MDQQQIEYIKEEVKRRISCLDYLEPSPDGTADKYCCPFSDCNSGKHDEPDSDGAVTYYEKDNDCFCFSCKRKFDVIDLHRQQTGQDFMAALRELADKCGLPMDADKNEAHISPQSNAKAAANTEATKDSLNALKPAHEPEKTKPDFTSYLQRCKARIGDPEAGKYLAERGISEATAAVYNLGYDANKKQLIIPCSSYYYSARQMPPIPKKRPKYDNPPSPSTVEPFNPAALYQEDPCFIVEGAFDALSVIEAGGQAVALNGNTHYSKLLSLLDENPPTAPLLLALDNDKDGQQTSHTLQKELTSRQIQVQQVNITGDHKDPNEALTADPAAFAQRVDTAIRRYGPRPDNTGFYIDSEFLQEVANYKPGIKTGFYRLDQKADGIHEGLYVLAAISSLGKTSFALQLADQIAAAGEDVLFFSLEQSKFELVSKSIARYTANQGPGRILNSLAVRSGKAPEVVAAAIAEYKEQVKDRISIIEGNFDCDVDYIRQYVDRYIRQTGKRPIVFIDYLQIIRPAEDKRQTTKEAIDATVTELRRMCRDLHLSVFAVSSVNRANYLTPIDFESLKESGGIEYTADAVWGLQLQCLSQEDIFDKAAQQGIKEKRDAVKRAKAENPRKIELVCLKNRFGVTGWSCFFDYHPAEERFTETADPNAARAYLGGSGDNDKPWPERKMI